jgi:hypothetical protein
MKMDDLSFLLVVSMVAPLEAAVHHPIIFVALSVGCVAGSWLASRPNSGLKWLLFIALLIPAIWAASLMIVCGLGLPGFAPH